MDFILPSDDTMELMREEFAKLKTGAGAHAFALSSEDDSVPEERQENRSHGVYISAVLLLLYFVKQMGYNTSYGTEIFNTHRGLEQIRPVGCSFGKLNDLN